jgi:hypothetical protein
MTQTPIKLDQQRYVTIHFPDYTEDEFHYGNPEYGFGQKIWLISEYEEYYQSKMSGLQIVEPQEYEIVGINVIRYLKHNRLIEHPYWEYTLEKINSRDKIVKKEFEIMLPVSDELLIKYF